MQSHLVSICIPTYNRPKLLSKLLDSILQQSYQDFEVIITDNSDNSDTQKLIESCYSDDRIRYLKNNSNLGMGGNVQRALDQVNGVFFTFTPDDDVWIDSKKLEKQVRFLQLHPNINIIYSNAESIDYDGCKLDEFTSVYQGSNQRDYAIIDSAELLPGFNTSYFLNILTPVIRTQDFLSIFRLSWYFESEEFFCYYLSASGQNIGFLFDKLVALREAEHYRTAFEDGKIVDWKKRKDIRIRQVIATYCCLVSLYPETKGKFDVPLVHNFFGKYLLQLAISSKSITLLFKTFFSCLLIFRKFNPIIAVQKKSFRRKSFG